VVRVAVGEQFRREPGDKWRVQPRRERHGGDTRGAADDRGETTGSATSSAVRASPVAADRRRVLDGHIRGASERITGRPWPGGAPAVLGELAAP
jgi:hypothetical protein